MRISDESKQMLDENIIHPRGVDRNIHLYLFVFLISSGRLKT